MCTRTSVCVRESEREREKGREREREREDVSVALSSLTEASKGKLYCHLVWLHGVHFVTLL